MRATLSTVMSVFRSMDKDRSNELDKAEWRKGLQGLFGDKYSAKTLNAAFDVFDADSSGKISYEELRVRLKETPEELEAFEAVKRGEAPATKPEASGVPTGPATTAVPSEAA
uniref:EF-hand domain-containing protein n=1 Tax=Haptolina ericina TaxID=156174 RepID=A0A7S3BBD0_9EUKA|mmetsp:Transcript_55903/g.124833  ORF Transcript_55903/g.124833 Transcript_55903/m.124833 type:complete len:112 (+) Transcript_55903:2-337(+)